MIFFNKEKFRKIWMVLDFQSQIQTLHDDPFEIQKKSDQKDIFPELILLSKNLQLTLVVKIPPLHYINPIPTRGRFCPTIAPKISLWLHLCEVTPKYIYLKVQMRLYKDYCPVAPSVPCSTFVLLSCFRVCSCKAGEKLVENWEP